MVEHGHQPSRIVLLHNLDFPKSNSGGFQNHEYGNILRNNINIAIFDRWNKKID